MKILKFTNSLSNLILSGKKTTTWRINDDKNLKVGDKLSLLNVKTKKEFAQAIIIYVTETYFGELTQCDWDGHEKFNSKKEMYLTYSNYYHFDVTSNTKLKVIKFKLI